MRVYELLTMLDKKGYQLQIRQFNNRLTGGSFNQEKLGLKLLNSKVESYDVYDRLELITISLKNWYK